MAFERTRIIGMEHALSQFRRAPEVARKFIGDAIRVTEITLAGHVRRAAPERTGALRLAIGSKTVGLKASITVEEGEFFGSNTPAIYWRFVEFGTKHMAAQPFIRPASEAEMAPMIERVKDAGKRMERELNI